MTENQERKRRNPSMPPHQKKKNPKKTRTTDPENSQIFNLPNADFLTLP